MDCRSQIQLPLSDHNCCSQRCGTETHIKHTSLHISCQNCLVAIKPLHHRCPGGAKVAVEPLNLQRLFLIGLVLACVLHTGADAQDHIDMVHPCTLYLLHLHATIFTPLQAATHSQELILVSVYNSVCHHIVHASVKAPDIDWCTLHVTLDGQISSCTADQHPCGRSQESCD